jgi:subtilisin family serine protease
MHRSPRRRRLLRSAVAFVLLVAVVVVAAQLAGVSTQRTQPPTTLVFEGVHERWMVKAPGTSAARLSKATARLGGGTAGRKLPGDWYEVKLSDEVAAADAEAAFGAVGVVEIEPVLPRLPYVEPTAVEDPGATTRSTLPGSHDDPAGAFDIGSSLRNGPVGAPRLGEQWSLTQASDQDIDAPEAWQVGTGAGAVVAVIDTGVDASHPDLVGRVLPGRDFSGAGTPATVDRVGHGTHVASLVAGNGTNMAGVAPDAQILPLKVFRDSATGFSMSGYVSAIRYAADQGADAINISLGCGGSTSCFSQAELDALTYAANRGVVIVTAAGNGDNTGRGMDNDSPQTPDYPSGYELPGLLSVTSSTRFGDWSTWSNFGRVSVDLAAPGEGILVASPGGSFRSVTGTSFSAPLVAGTVALVAAANPTANADDVASRVLAGVVPGGSLATRTATGGILNAHNALFAVGSASIAGGGAVTGPTPTSPRPGAQVAAPPVLAWTLPAGWTSLRVSVQGMGRTFDRTVPAASRASSHPPAAWRSGTYRWTVVARTPDGRQVVSAPRSYLMLPRLNAWVSSGRIRPGGDAIRLRVGYAASEPRASVRVRVRSGRTVLHDGRATPRTTHLRGVGSPRRGWFAYDARIGQSLRRGQRVTVEVFVTAGGRTLVRRFNATVG